MAAPRQRPANGRGKALRFMLLWRLATDTNGASAAEYALLLAVIGSGLAIAAITMGDSIACSFDRTSETIATGEVPGSPNYGNSNPQGNANGHRDRCRN